MSSYAYVAVQPDGSETRGTLEVPDQSEALRRLREMGLFPTKLLKTPVGRSGPVLLLPRQHLRREWSWSEGRVKASHLAVFTRQLATLVEAGMPLLRGLRTLEEQAERPRLRRVINDVAEAIENGGSLAEAVAAHPRIFNRLYVSLVKAGELGGALELTLARLAEFMEKAQKLKGKVRAALFYPCAVLVIALGVLITMVVFVVPRFKLVFDGLLGGAPLPAFTRLVFGISDAAAHHWAWLCGAVAIVIGGLAGAVRTSFGRRVLDECKLAMPVLGPLFRKLAVARFAGTLGTLLGNGVPVLQALAIVKETAGNVVVGDVLVAVQENVKQGEPLAPTLKGSGVFPAMVAGMVDVGEQTGALPEMLLKIADTYDAEVDSAASALSSLLEPIMLVLLAGIVGSIVIAMFLPLIYVASAGFDGQAGRPQE